MFYSTRTEDSLRSLKTASSREVDIRLKACSRSQEMTPSPRQRGAKTWTVGHRRRLVINIGGKNLGHKYWGAKILGKYVFRQHSKNF